MTKFCFVVVAISRCSLLSSLHDSLASLPDWECPDCHLLKLIHGLWISALYNPTSNKSKYPFKLFSVMKPSLVFCVHSRSLCKEEQRLQRKWEILNLVISSKVRLTLTLNKLHIIASQYWGKVSAVSLNLDFVGNWGQNVKQQML